MLNAVTGGTEPPFAITEGRPPYYARRHVVVSSHYLASMAGMRMFDRGGNAADAGVATGVALNVLERHLTDFGGVAPIMFFGPGMRAPETIDGVGHWPSALDLQGHRERYGDDMPFGVSRFVTPAAADAWLTALARYGRLRLADVLGPAIELCGGFPSFERLSASIAALEPRLREWPESARTFLPNGKVPQPGDLIVQTELGQLLRRLVSVEEHNAASGRPAAIMAARDEFYIGAIGQKIAQFAKRVGSPLSVEDLARQRVAIAPSIHSTYRGVEVHACGPWSQGPLVPMTLNILEGFDVSSMGAGSAEFVHHFVEAMKLSFADREGFFGDPDQIDVPIVGLMDRAYAHERGQLIRRDRASRELPLPGDPWKFESRTGQAGFVPQPRRGAGYPDTCYVAAMDDEGNAFSATPSDPGLSAPLVDGLGVIISTRGAQLWTNPNHPSRIAPWKRPRLTPNPGMLVQDGRAFLPFGCPGGDAQAQAMVQFVCNVMDFKMNVQAAIEYPRAISASFPWSFHPHPYEPGVLRVESRLDASVRDRLANMGHKVQVMPAFTPAAAAVCAIRRLDSGTMEGGADPRLESYSIGW